MRWPDIDSFAREAALPPGARVRRLTRADIPTLVRLLSEWHPEFTFAEDVSLLEERYYTENVALAGEVHTTMERPVYVVLQESEGAPVGCVMCEVEADGAVLLGRFSIIAPRFRRRGLGRVNIDLWVALTRAIGASVTYLLVDHTVSPGVVKHAFEAVYSISLLPPAQSYTPPRAAMPPRVAALADFVYGPPEEAPA